jgi:hypothetical protein
LLHLTFARKQVSQEALSFGLGEWLEEERENIPVVGNKAGISYML